MLEREFRSTVPAEFAPEDATFKRMQVLDVEHQAEPEHYAHRRAGAPPGDCGGAPDDRFEMPFTVVRRPRFAVDLIPFRVRHFRMMSHTMMQVVFVEVGIHPLAAT